MVQFPPSGAGSEINDPHVASLTYRVEHSDTVDSNTSLPVVAGNSDFQVTMDAGKAHVEMLDHFATEREARDVVKPFLCAWELAADLKRPQDRFRFVFERAEVEDRNPQLPGRAARTAIAGETSSAFSMLVHVSLSSWPEPPADLAVSELVNILHNRWLEYLERRGPISPTRCQLLGTYSN